MIVNKHNEDKKIFKEKFKTIKLTAGNKETESENEIEYVTRLHRGLETSEYAKEIEMLENCRIVPTVHTVALTTKPPMLDAKDIYNNVAYDLVRNKN